MKIAHLISQFYPYVGGAEICVHNVCRTLSAAGHEAVIITTAFEPAPGLALPYQVETLWNRTCGLLQRFPMLGKKYLHGQLAGLQKKYSFDLCQVTAGYPLGVYAVDFFRKNKIPCILRCCGEDIQKFPQIDYGYRLDAKIDALITEKYPLFDGFVALTPTVREEYLKLGIHDDRISIIPNGADFAKFAKGRKSAERICEIRNKFNVGKRKLILTIGRYHSKKGYDLIPEIAAELRRNGIDFVWVVAGRHTPVLQQKYPQCGELGIICSEDYMRSDSGDLFSLPPDSLVELYCAADIFVLPTLIETFGMVLVEAMAAGLPIVTTDAPGVRDVIDDGVNGLKAPVGNIDAISGNIAEVLSNAELAGKLSCSALDFAENIYDWNKVTGKYVDLYLNINSK